MQGRVGPREGGVALLPGGWSRTAGLPRARCRTKVGMKPDRGLKLDSLPAESEWTDCICHGVVPRADRSGWAGHRLPEPGMSRVCRGRCKNGADGLGAGS